MWSQNWETKDHIRFNPDWYFQKQKQKMKDDIRILDRNLGLTPKNHQQ